MAKHARRRSGSRAPSLTVAQIVREYLADRSAEGRNTAGAAQQLSAHVLPVFGHRRVVELTVRELKAWRDALAATPPRVRRPRGCTAELRLASVDLADPDVRRRRRSTVNRITATFKAALNHAASLHPEQLHSRDRWRIGLRAFRNVEAARERWLELAEIRRLLDACAPDFRELVRAALYTGCRYGELRRAKVGDYLRGARALRIGITKSGRWRDVILHAEAAAFFDTITVRRRPGEWLLTRRPRVLVALHAALAPERDWSATALEQALARVARALGVPAGTVAQHLALALGEPAKRCVAVGRERALERLAAGLAKPWGPSQQARPIAAACVRAGIQPPISFHGLRHTYASLAVQSGMALIALATNLGHADTRMVEKHYGHLSNRYLREQVDRHAPSLGRTRGNERRRAARPRRTLRDS